MSAIAEIREAVKAGANDAALFDIAKRHGMRLPRLTNDEIEIVIWRLDDAEKTIAARDAKISDDVRAIADRDSRIRLMQEAAERKERELVELAANIAQLEAESKAAAEDMCAALAEIDALKTRAERAAELTRAELGQRDRHIAKISDELTGERKRVAAARRALDDA